MQLASCLQGAQTYAYCSAVADAARNHGILGQNESNSVLFQGQIMAEAGQMPWVGGDFTPGNAHHVLQMYALTKSSLGRGSAMLSSEVPEGEFTGFRFPNNQPDAESDSNSSNNTAGSQSSGRYSGNLVKVNKPDEMADLLAERIGGVSRVKFDSDPDGREFDAISPEYIGQTKPPIDTFNKRFRNSAKATFDAAEETGRLPYFHFEGEPASEVTRKLTEYSQRYNMPYVLDTEPLKE